MQGGPGIRGAATGALAVLTAACGGEPPDELGGFRLSMSQQEVVDASRAAGSFTCRARATPPALTCEGATAEGPVRVIVRDGVTRSVTLRLDPGGEDSQRAVRRFVDDFGDPAWRERPVPPRAPSPEGYHTVWLDEDTTRAVAAVCAGRELRPPCTLELTPTSPAAISARLDSLLGIRR